MSGEQEKTDAKTVDSPWARSKNCDWKPLRPPNSSSTESEQATSSETTVKSVEEKDTANDSDDILVKSQLNINAAEFIPSSQRNQEINDSTELVINYLRNLLNLLTISPGEYDVVWEALCDVIKPYAHDQNVLKFVTNTIIERCISDSNVCYSGARLCKDLHKLCGNDFRNILLSSCEEEYAKFISNLDDSGNVNRICGFGLMLAELFLQVQVHEKNIVILGEELLEILQAILSCESEKSIKFVCQILKLTGIQLEELDDASSKKLDDLFSHLQLISTKYPDLDPNLLFTIENVTEMRNSDWGQRRTEQPSSEVAKDVNYHGLNEPVFFGPDGKIVTEEETDFLHENLPMSDDKDDYVCEQDELDEEMCAAYEEFIKMSQKGENGK